MFTKAFLLSAIATLAAAQSAVLTFTHVPNPVTDGQAQAITYATNDTTSPVTITLRKGLSTDLQTIETLTTTATGGQYVWTPSLSLPNGVDYALQITQGSQVNYFGPFVVQGASVYASSSASASSNATTTTATTVVPPVGTNSAGTGTALPRNTTMSVATLTSASSSRPASNTASATTSSGAGFQSATGSASASQSASGASNIQIGSSIALLGAIAAAVFMQ